MYCCGGFKDLWLLYIVGFGVQECWPWRVAASWTVSVVSLATPGPWLASSPWTLPSISTTSVYVYIYHSLPLVWINLKLKCNETCTVCCSMTGWEIEISTAYTYLFCRLGTLSLRWWLFLTSMVRPYTYRQGWLQGDIVPLSLHLSPWICFPGDTLTPKYQTDCYWDTLLKFVARGTIVPRQSALCTLQSAQMVPVSALQISLFLLLILYLSTWRSQKMLVCMLLFLLFDTLPSIVATPVIIAFQLVAIMQRQH